MSQVSTDVRAFFGIASDLFDGKASLSQAGQRLDALGQTIASQVKTDVAEVESFLGPQAAANINAGLNDAKQALGAGLAIVDADLAPYVAGATKAAEGAVDAVLTASLGAGAAVINPLVNGGIDSLAGALKAAIDSQAAAWKARLATAGQPAPTPAPQPAN